MSFWPASPPPGTCSSRSLCARVPRAARGPASEAGVLRETVSALRDRPFLLFAALAFVFPLSMGLVVVASPL